MAVSPLASLIAFLKADPAVNTACTGRVFGEVLPQSESASMPRAAVVVQSYGGTGFNSLNVHNASFLFRTYGASLGDAEQLQSKVVSALRRLSRAAVSSAGTGTLLHSAILATGPFYGRDPETYWIFYYSTWSVAADYREVN